jgi:drug/metabolite transporter (DMT)-like permease
MRQKRDITGIILTVSSAICFGALSLFVTLLSREGVGAWIQVGARLVASTVIFLVILLLFAPGALRIVTRRQFLLLLANGAVLLVAFTTFVLAIFLGTPAAKVVLIIYTYPIFVVLAASKILGEKITRKQRLAVLVGILGAAVVMKFWDVQGLLRPQPGDLVAIGNTVVYGALILLTRRCTSQEQIHPLALNFWSVIFALMWLVPGVIGVLAWQGTGGPLLTLPDDVGTGTLLNLLGLVVLGTVVPYGLMNAGLQRTEAGTASVLMLAEPVSVLAISAVFLHQPIDLWNIVGGAIILIAGFLAAR